MSSCCFRRCPSYEAKYNKKTHGITYHLFPKTDKKQRKKWIEICRKQMNRPKWEPIKSTVICSKHFKLTDLYVKKSGRVYLHKDAIPIINKEHVLRDIYHETSASVEITPEIVEELDCVENSGSGGDKLKAMVQDVMEDPLAEKHALNELPPEKPKVNGQPAERNKLNEETIEKDQLDEPIVEIHVLDEPKAKLNEERTEKLDLMEPQAKKQKSKELRTNEMSFIKREAKQNLKHESNNENELILCDVPIDKIKKPVAEQQKCKQSKTLKKHKLNVNEAIICSVSENKKHKPKDLKSEKVEIPEIQITTGKSGKKLASVLTILDYLNRNKYISDDQFLKLNEKTEILDSINRTYLKTNFKGSLDLESLPTLKRFALLLNFYSTAAYKHVRKVFLTALPHPRTLSKWYEKPTDSPGFTQKAFNILKRKSSSLGQRLLCTLITDEIALQHQAIFTGNKNNIGLVDFGISRSNEIATHVYIFTLVSLNDDWKIPIGYFFTNSLSNNIRANLIKICISKCFDSGVDVVAVTLHGCLSNLAVANILGCDLNSPNNLKTTFPHPDCGKEIALFLDPHHTFTLVRNALETNKVLFGNNNNKMIRWRLIEAMTQLKTYQKLKFAENWPQHVNLRNKLMKIKLAILTLSRTLTDALELCKKVLKSEFNDIGATVEFIAIFNDLLDVFNFNTSITINECNAAKTFQFLKKAEEYIFSLRIRSKMKGTVAGQAYIYVTEKPIVECKSNAGFLGILVNIKSLKRLYNTYVTGAILPDSSVKSITPCKLSQDYIEFFFGTIRGHGRYKNNPNTLEFIELYKRILDNFKSCSGLMKNSIPLKNIVPVCSYLPSAILNINSSLGLRVYDDTWSISNIYFNFDKYTKNNAFILAAMLNDTNCSETAEQIIGYVSSWIARVLIEAIKCETCVDVIYSAHKLWFHKLITVKDMSGICYSSENVYLVCRKSEAIIKHYLKENNFNLVCDQEFGRLKSRILKAFLGSNIFQILHEHSLRQPPMFSHRIHVIKAIIDKYTKIRLRSLQTYSNKIMKKETKKLNLFK